MNEQQAFAAGYRAACRLIAESWEIGPATLRATVDNLRVMEFPALAEFEGPDPIEGRQDDALLAELYSQAGF